MKKKAEDATLNAAASVVGALATGSTHSQALVVGALAWGASLARPMSDWVGRRWKRLGDGYAPGADGAAAAGLLSDAANDNPESAASVIEMLRWVRDSLNEDVLPILGRILREYTDAHRPPDGHLRSIAGFLSDLDVGDLHEVRALLGYVLANVTEPQVQFAELVAERTPTGWVVKPLKAQADSTGPESPPREVVLTYPLRIFALLKSRLLGRDNPSGFPDTEGGPHVLLIELLTTVPTFGCVSLRM